MTVSCVISATSLTVFVVLLHTSHVPNYRYVIFPDRDSHAHIRVPDEEISGKNTQGKREGSLGCTQNDLHRHHCSVRMVSPPFSKHDSLIIMFLSLVKGTVLGLTENIFKLPSQLYILPILLSLPIRHVRNLYLQTDINPDATFTLHMYSTKWCM